LLGLLTRPNSFLKVRHESWCVSNPNQWASWKTSVSKPAFPSLASVLQVAIRFSVKGLVDLPLSDVVDAWTNHIPSALGAGTAQD